ncbi:MAG: efflux RND transporter permease subunit [Firmicutes bacterium]|nr:efflux RND transporter permease subunit [Bacillota bacterium]
MLTKLSVNKPYTVIVAVVIIALLGIAAFAGIRTDLLPDVDYPYAVVVTDYPDASPEEVENTVTKPMEKALVSLGKVKSVDSVSTKGRSVITVEFESSVNMDNIVAEMREAFEPLRTEWGNAVASPVIRKINPDTMPVIVASVDVEGQDAFAISEFVKENLMTYFDGIDGVADISLEGIVNERVQITIDPKKLAEVNKVIFDAIGGDFEKARAALEATDAELNGASSQMSSDLLNEAASIDAQLRTLNQQLAKAKAEESTSGTEIDAIKANIKKLEDEYIVLAEDPAPTPEEEARKAELEKQLSAERAKLTEAEKNLNEENSDIASLNRQIAALESRRSALMSQMSSSESELAKSRAEITEQLGELAEAEEAAKAEADLETLITTEMVSTMLASQNFSSTAGSLALGNREYDVKVGDEIASVQELENLVLFHFNLEDVDDVLLSDVANISLVNNSDEVYSRIDGHDGVLISFMKQSDYSTAEVAANIWETFDKVIEMYPSVSITTLSDQSVYIDRVSSAVVQNLLFGAILAIFVLLLFLKDLRPTLVVAVSIPVSLLGALALMFFTGVTLNVFSLAGLALGVGMLVDNSIVVMENIYRCRTIGMSRHDAAMEGTKQVAAAIIASTLTTICVFLPVVFTNGLSRQLFADIGLTIAYALLASLFIAFTLVPAMSSGVLRTMERRTSVVGPGLKEKYTGVLRWVLSHRVFVLCFAVLIAVFTGIFAMNKGTSFLPETDSSEMSLSVTMKEDTSEDVLWKTTDHIMELLLMMEGVDSVGAVANNDVALTDQKFSDGSSTTVYVVLDPKKKQSCQEIESQILQQTENLGCHVDVSIGSYDLSSLYEDGIGITVSGSDLDTLSGITADMGDLLLSVQGLKNIKSSVDTATPTLKVSVNKNEAMKYGLTVAEVCEFISRSISNSANATTLKESDTDVVVIDGSAGDLALSDIQNLKMVVTDEEGVTQEISIGSIATISEESGAPVIYRDNQSRYMTAYAEVAEGYNVGNVSEEVSELVDGYEPPEGYRITLTGEETVINDSFRDLIFVVSLAILLMYLIMVAQFQSLLTPLLIMVTVPLSFTGGFLALLISGRDLSVIALVGFLLLSGIVVNNSIVLVDYINRLRKSDKVLCEAVIEAACTRARPVLMTATTTILALITLAFGMGLGAEVVQPMAIVVFGGMIYATLITLFVVPGLYDLFHRRKEDTIAEMAQGYYREEEETPDEVHLEKRSSNAEEEKEEKRSNAMQRFMEKRRAEKEADSDDEDEEMEEEVEERTSRFGFFHRRKDKTESFDEEVESDDEEDAEDDEKPRFRFFRRRAEDIEEFDEEDDEDDSEEEKVKPRHYFRLPLFRKEKEEDNEEEDEDDDYYGLKLRRRDIIDEETRRRVLEIPKDDSFSSKK